MYNKFKYVLADDAFYYGFVVLLTAVTSFGLGRWSMIEDTPINQQISVTNTQNASLPIPLASNQSATDTTTVRAIEVLPTQTTQTEPKYVGSKNSTKYHLLTCPGAKTIKDSNKVFFMTKEDAQKAGYTPASNCKGI